MNVPDELILVLLRALVRAEDAKDARLMVDEIEAERDNETLAAMKKLILASPARRYYEPEVLTDPGAATCSAEQALEWAKSADARERAGALTWVEYRVWGPLGKDASDSVHGVFKAVVSRGPEEVERMIRRVMAEALRKTGGE